MPQSMTWAVKMPNYSIIIPCYRDGLLAIKAIESCLSQTYRAKEIIFIDDGSPDDSYDLVANAFSKADTVKCYRIENSGVSRARNFGLGKSTGDWIIFLDADDLLGNNYLEEATICISSCRKKEETVFVAPFCYFEMPNSARAKWVKKYRPPILGESRFLNLFKLSITNCFPVSSAIVPRAVAKGQKLFNENLTHYEDWELWINLANQCVIFRYIKPSIDSATLIRIRNGVSSNSDLMLNARKQIARVYFAGTIMAFWQIPFFGDKFRKLIVGIWRFALEKNLNHPNLSKKFDF